MDADVAIALFGTFMVLVFIGVPVSFSIGISTVIAVAMSMPTDIAISVIAQRLAAGLDSFSLLAIPFFILAGTFMTNGGIAIRLINLALVIGGRLPGSLAHVNVLANMMFGSISGSAVASAAAVGGTLAPIQKKSGYDPAFSTAVNVSSCISGLLIPPSNVLIIYSLSAGGVSVAALFVAGYVPGILLGLSVMITAGIIASRRGYPVEKRPSRQLVIKSILDSLPSLSMIGIVIGGILGGVFTATEASAIAVVYTFILSVVVYREVKPRQIPKLILESVVTSSIVLLLVGFSMGMSWAMTNAGIPHAISDYLLGISENPIIILLMITLTLLLVGVFMDMTPAVLIFTPILLPVATDLGVDPLHFGIMMVFNLCIGLCTPPVGSALFVGCSVSGVKIHNLIKPLLPFYAALIAMLLVITYIPWLTLLLPRLLGLN